MKKIDALKFAVACIAATAVAASAEVVKQPVHDNVGGTIYGGMTGMMIGATGGPLGALVGAGIGMFVGKNVQEATGLSQRAYIVEQDNGRQVVVRSPNYAFAPNDRVRLVSDRLLPVE